MKTIENRNPNQELEETIQSIFDEHDENYGYRRIQLELKNRGIHSEPQKSAAHHDETRIKRDKFTRKSRRYSSYKGTVGTCGENLIQRRFNTTIPYQKLTTDITEFKCSDGRKLYLSPMMDMYNGEILSYGINMRPTLDFVIKPLKKPWKSSKTQNTEQRSTQIKAGIISIAKWVATLKEHNVFQSMSRKGNCLDNSPMENFFGLLKQEMYYGEPLAHMRN